MEQSGYSLGPSNLNERTIGIDMKRPLPLHCHYFTDRHGKNRIRFQIRFGFSTYIKSKPGTPEFRKEYALAMLGKLPSVKKAYPGTISKLIEIYYKSPEFVILRDTTKPGYRSTIEQFRKEHGNKRVGDLKLRHLKDVIAKMADRPHAANKLIKRLSVVLDCAIDLEWIENNPAKKLKKFTAASEGHYLWTEDDIERFEAFHLPGTKPRLALTILLYSACRIGDLVLLGKQHAQRGRLKYTQTKTNQSVDIPIHTELAKEIGLIEHSELTFLLAGGLNEYATKKNPTGYTSRTAGHWFRKQCDAAGLPKCSAHGLRKAAATRMAESGMTPHQIQAVTGHRTLSEVTKYTEKANRKKLADVGVQGLTRDKK